MKQYLDLLQNILDNGIRQSNRTGVDTLTLPGAMLKFDLRDNFPAVTTKKLAFNAVKGELIGFLRGSRSLKEFKELGCNVWDANVAAQSWQDNQSCMNRNDMGRIYGTHWRNWVGVEHSRDDEMSGMEGIRIRHIDQIAVALDTVRNNPHSRRIVVSAWNAAELTGACLPPCHVLFQLLPHVDSKVLHMTMYQRSCDMFLGVPFNIASYALLLHLFAAWSGYTAGILTMFLADAHIYVNHIDQVKEQISREPKELPLLWIDGCQFNKGESLNTLISMLEPETMTLFNYSHHAPIKADMAV